METPRTQETLPANDEDDGRHRQGKGCFVASDSETETRIREQELAQQLEQAARSAAILGLSSKELEKCVRATWDGVTGMVKVSV
jgi:DNA-binding transcriptional regulator YhcF (GntR family)